MNGVGLIAWGLSGICALIVAALWLAEANRKLDQLILTDLTDDEPQPFDDLRFRRHADMALALLAPDSELLPAEEAQR